MLSKKLIGIFKPIVKVKKIVIIVYKKCLLYICEIFKPYFWIIVTELKRCFTALTSACVWRLSPSAYKLGLWKLHATFTEKSQMLLARPCLLHTVAGLHRRKPHFWLSESPFIFAENSVLNYYRILCDDISSSHNSFSAGFKLSIYNSDTFIWLSFNQAMNLDVLYTPRNVWCKILR